MDAIKLYTRTTCSWKSSDDKYIDEVNQFIKENIKHQIQCPQRIRTLSKRKKNPIDIEVSFYDIDTVIEIATDIKYKRNIWK